MDGLANFSELLDHSPRDTRSGEERAVSKALEELAATGRHSSPRQLVHCTAILTRLSPARVEAVVATLV